MTTEYRFSGAPAPELVATSTGKHIQGYASVFNKMSRKLPGGFVERVDTRAFDAAANDGYADTIARFDHRGDAFLGSVNGGTLQIVKDSYGLAYDVVPPSNMAHVIELCQRGDIKSSSFAFSNPEDDWEMSDFGLPLRTLLSVNLVDVAPVVQPAYPDASAFARSMAGGAVESLAYKFSADPSEIRTMMDNGSLSKLFKLTTPKGSNKPDEGIIAKYRQLKMLELKGKALSDYAETSVAESERWAARREEMMNAIKPKQDFHPAFVAFDSSNTTAVVSTPQDAQKKAEDAWKTVKE